MLSRFTDALIIPNAYLDDAKASIYAAFKTVGLSPDLKVTPVSEIKPKPLLPSDIREQRARSSARKRRRYAELRAAFFELNHIVF